MSTKQISNTAHIKFKFILALALMVALGLTNYKSASGLPGTPETVNPSSDDFHVPADLDQSVYLPFVTNKYPLPPSPFGVETYPPRIDLMEFINDLDANWVRVDAFEWKTIEPVRTDPPEYHWESVDEAYLQELSANNKRVIATIRHTPEWAQKIPGHDCGPIAEDSLDEFAEFIQELVKRYGVSPYNIKIWQLGNEPDIDPNYISPTSDLGCWGDETDPYFGGEYYATMLQHAYPAFKAVDPAAIVTNGGLLMHCDPDNPPPPMVECLPGTFFEGILRNSGGDYLDFVSFHGYAVFYSSAEYPAQIVDENFPGWDTRGGVVLGKIDFLQELMEQYNVSKPLMMTEAGLRCPWYWEGQLDCDPPTDEYYERQADYVVWLYVRNWNNDVINTVWFTLNYMDWQHTELLLWRDIPKPSYYSYKFLAQELKGVELVRKLNEGQFTDFQAYEFLSEEKYIWVVWTPDHADRVLTLPDNVTQIFDKYGTVIPLPTPPDNEISVDSPIYIEIAP